MSALTLFSIWRTDEFIKPIGTNTDFSTHHFLFLFPTSSLVNDDSYPWRVMSTGNFRRQRGKKAFICNAENIVMADVE